MYAGNGSTFPGLGLAGSRKAITAENPVDRSGSGQQFCGSDAENVAQRVARRCTGTERILRALFDLIFASITRVV